MVFAKFGKRISVVVLLILVVVILSSCGVFNHKIKPAHLAVLSVSGAQMSASSISMGSRSLDTPVWGRGHIDSGPPDYVKITLERITLVGNFGTSSNDIAVIWDHPEGVEITVSDSGAVDLTGVPDINVSSVPIGTVTGVNLMINYHGTICGQLHNPQFVNNTTITDLYTKADYAYNPSALTGGATDYTSFTTGPAEPADIYFNGDGNVDQTIETPVSFELDGSTVPKLTILVDISRMLRFYDGLDTQGPGGLDVTDKAYFFCHSLFAGGSRPIACFFGDAGAIQGYQVIYDVTDDTAHDVSSPVDIPAWLTLIYKPSGDILSGILIGDDDNALTVAKGTIINPFTVDLASGAYNFTSDISDVTVYNFLKVDTVNSYCTDISWVQNSNRGFIGTARFILKYQSP